MINKLTSLWVIPQWITNSYQKNGYSYNPIFHYINCQISNQSTLSKMKFHFRLSDYCIRKMPSFSWQKHINHFLPTQHTQQHNSQPHTQINSILNSTKLNPNSQSKTIKKNTISNNAHGIQRIKQQNQTKTLNFQENKSKNSSRILNFEDRRWRSTW